MIILVTGMSSGFGKAIAKSLVSNGHKVFGTVRRNVEILCISSIGGLIGLPYQGAYSASKFAMEGFFNRIHSDTKERQCRDGLRCLPFLCTFPRKHRERREQRPKAGLSRISNMPHSREEEAWIQICRGDFPSEIGGIRQMASAGTGLRLDTFHLL